MHTLPSMEAVALWNEGSQTFTSPWILLRIVVITLSPLQPPAFQGLA